MRSQSPNSSALSRRRSSAARSRSRCSRRCGIRGTPRAIVDAEGLAQVEDTAIDAVVDDVIAANAGVVEQHRAGKTSAMGFLVGQVMKASRGKANPRLVTERLAARLGGM
ncbi:MAG: hypothetical protein R2752_13875 [Vicinamibacterales bacterium]